jgi:hypothetical protein
MPLFQRGFKAQCRVAFLAARNAWHLCRIVGAMIACLLGRANRASEVFRRTCQAMLPRVDYAKPGFNLLLGGISGAGGCPSMWKTAQLELLFRKF